MYRRQNHVFYSVVDRVNAQPFCIDERGICFLGVERSVASGSFQFLNSFACNLRVYSKHAEGLDISRKFSNLISNQSGVTAIEYALIAALIAVAAIAAFTLVSTNLSTTFSTIAGQL